MTGSTLSPEQLEELGGRLRRKQSELREQIASLRKVTSVRPDCTTLDAADTANLIQSNQNASVLIGQGEKTLAEVDAAIARLEAGCYGLSEVTGEPIEYARLLAIPWARAGANE